MSQPRTRHLSGGTGEAASLAEVGPYLTFIENADPLGASTYAAGMVDAGARLASVVEDVLAPAQVEVGRRWQAGEWTVAQEHAASAVTDAALAAAALSLHRQGGLAGPAAAVRQPTVVLCCAEGEWHSLAARMAAEVLVESGVAVTFLGPSLPPDQLQAYLTLTQPTALGLSCSVPLSLPGVRACVLAAHEVGVPVVASGRGFGDGGRWTGPTGADLWVPAASAAVGTLTGWHEAPPTLKPVPPVPDEAVRLASIGAGFVDEVMAELGRRDPTDRVLSSTEEQRTREDVGYIRRFCACAVMAGDPTLFAEFTHWLADVLHHREVPVYALATTYLAIAAVLGDGHLRAHGLLVDGAASLDGW